ncbi:hypothetical protein [Ruminococcus sp.]|uniref:hypothetical protein n=1 Tax=Ruminococcus sp. TaxID=41978 RepID=UPI001B64457A|nr:hypothetical protein [Ruminococcus sp.]MBP5432205.1 hypothetical protein [Ruminococcus sp.]
MYYVASTYVCDDTTAIRAYSDSGECECTVTINLIDYGLRPENNEHVYIPAYKIQEYSQEIFNQILSDLVEEVKDEVFIGHNNSCKCLYVKLKENWRDLDLVEDRTM